MHLHVFIGRRKGSSWQEWAALDRTKLAEALLTKRSLQAISHIPYGHNPTDLGQTESGRVVYDGRSITANVYFLMPLIASFSLEWLNSAAARFGALLGCCMAIISCSKAPDLAAGSTLIRYGSFFELSIPTQRLAGAKFFNTGEVAVKFPDDSMIAPSLVTHDSESLPENFDLRKFADYLFDPAARQSIEDVEIRASFESSAAVIQMEHGDGEFIDLKKGELTLRGICSKLNCQLFVVQLDQAEQILMVNSRGIAPEGILDMLREV